MAPVPPSCPPSIPKKISTPPMVWVHPAYLFEIREKLDRRSRVYALIKMLVNKFVNDPAVHSVTFSKKFGPGGPNAFLSYAPYFHPNKAALEEYLKAHPGAPPEEWENQIPWERVDGKRNPDLGGATQGDELAAVVSKVTTLALSYHFAVKFDPSMAEKYAEKAHQLLWVFFGDEKTAMIPEVEYGQYVRGNQDKKSDFRPEGLLHVRSLADLSQVIPLLPPPPSQFSPHPFMCPWLERHIAFLQNSELGKMAAVRNNNIQSWYHALLSTHLFVLNRAQEAFSSIQTLFSKIGRKVDPETGVLGHEVTRTKPFHYCAFELEPLIYCAELAETLKRYTLPDGASLPNMYETENKALQRALDFSLSYYIKCLDSEKPCLPNGVPRVENQCDPRELVFQTRVLATRYDARDDYSWLIGNGGSGEMEAVKGKEEGWKPATPYLNGWNIIARLKWALLEGY